MAVVGNVLSCDEPRCETAVSLDDYRVPGENGFAMPLDWMCLTLTKHTDDANQLFLDRTITLSKFFCCTDCYENWLARKYHEYCEERHDIRGKRGRYNHAW